MKARLLSCLLLLEIEWYTPSRPWGRATRFDEGGDLNVRMRLPQFFQETLQALMEAPKPGGQLSGHIIHKFFKA